MERSPNCPVMDDIESPRLPNEAEDTATPTPEALHKDIGNGEERDVEADVVAMTDNVKKDNDDDDHGEDDEDGYDDDQVDEENERLKVERKRINACLQCRSSLIDFFVKNRKTIRKGLIVIAMLAFCVYFLLSMVYSFGDEDSLRLVGMTSFLVLVLLVKLIGRCCQHSRAARRKSKLLVKSLRRISRILRSLCCPILLVLSDKALSRVISIAMALAFVAYIIIAIGQHQLLNFLSLVGIVFFILAAYFCSINPSKVQWRTVFWGLSIQILLAIMILKTQWGYYSFNWLGDRVTEFLSHTDVGSRFVFGNSYEQHYMAFKVFPVVVFFSTVVSILYHVGALQGLIVTLGRFLSFLLGTSPAESISASANIFIGMTEAPLVIGPYLDGMTDSELHCVMTGGFATIAGGILAAYILFKVPATHLISASVMSAPAALVISKILYPELKKSRHRNNQVMKRLAISEAHSLIEAASNGAVMTVQVIANVVVNLIAFIALLYFINSTLGWFGGRVGYEEFSFQVICSYLFWPLAFVMGVDYQDCLVMAELIGMKTFINEFVAFVELSKYINNRIIFEEYLANATDLSLNLTGGWTTMLNGSIHLNDTDIILERGIISHRTIVIATYALCGFANLGSTGIMIGGLGALAPKRKSDLAKLALSAMIAGNVACFMTACVAGLLYSENG